MASGFEAVLLTPHAEVGVCLRQLAIALDLGGEGGLRLLPGPEAFDDRPEVPFLLRQPGSAPVVIGEAGRARIVGLDPIADLLRRFPATAVGDQSQQPAGRRVRGVGQHRAGPGA